MKGISANIQYRSSLGVIFACKKYADALWEVVKRKGINVHLRQHLVEIKPDTKEAVFEDLDTNKLVKIGIEKLEKILMHSR